jgi:sugar lactone lactonase YvrE
MKLDRPRLSIALALVLACTAGCEDGAVVDSTSSGAGGGAASSSTDAASTSADSSSAAGTTSATTASAGGGGGQGPIAFLDEYPLAVTYPEGGAFDEVSRAFYVGSLESGTVHAIDAETGAESTLFTETFTGKWLTLGMKVDEPNRALWVCAADQDTDPWYGELWRFDLDTKQRTAIIPLSAGAESAWCEDVTVDSKGNAYATDRENPNIYRVAKGASVATLFATDPELGSSFIGQNGIVVLPGDAAIIATVHFPARLNRIDITTGTVTPITITGDFADATIGSGADGMVYSNGALYVIFDGELVEVKPTLADWTAVTATEARLSGGLTDVMATPGGLYVVNGQAIGFVFGEDPDPFHIVKFTGSF